MPNDSTETHSLAQDVHWITHASFWSQVGLGVIGIFALCIYRGQLDEMRKSTKATAQAAYAACVSAQISRAAVIDAENGSVDTHNFAAGSVAQAAAATRNIAAQVVPIWHTPVSPPVVGTPISANFRIQNVGNSSAINLVIHHEVEILDIGKEPDFTFPSGRDWGVSNIGVFTKGDTDEWKTFSSDHKGNVVNFTEEQVRGVSEQTKYMSIYWKATYRDIFGVPHEDSFCTHVWGPKRGGNHYPKCAQYNKSDTNMLIPLRLQSPKASPVIPEIVCTKPEA